MARAPSADVLLTSSLFNTPLARRSHPPGMDRRHRTAPPGCAARTARATGSPPAARYISFGSLVLRLVQRVHPLLDGRRVVLLDRPTSSRSTADSMAADPEASAACPGVSRASSPAPYAACVRVVARLDLFLALARRPRRATPASFIIRSTSSLLRPLDAVIWIFCSFCVAMSFAETFTMPLASMSNVTSICGTPRGAGGRPDEVEPSQRPVVARHRALALQHVHLDARLAVRRGREHLALARRDRRVARDQRRQHAAHASRCRARAG